MKNAPVRLATPADIKALVELENTCFDSDRISQRSFKYFITKSTAELWVIGSPVVAYALILFHRGTSLARVYSLAVSPQHRGEGLAKKLLLALEDAATARDTLFIRLEVSKNNQGAIALYQSLGYSAIRNLPQYYEDGSDGTQMEKHLNISRNIPDNLPYFAQTTEFTCGPASLLMAMKYLDSKITKSPIHELNIWREATTIFMTTGHGGTSPIGLALAAQHRGFKARLWLSNTRTPFIDSVRNAEKKAIIELIHQDFLQQAEQENIAISDFPKGLQEVKNAVDSGEQIILLISTYRLNRYKEPHWIWLVHMDDKYAYFNDPSIDHESWKSATDSIYVPVPLVDLEKMMRYGRNQYRAAILISK